jgi:hypothetical protein
VIINRNSISINAVMASPAWFTVNFPTPPTVTAGTQYALVISTNEAGIVPTVSAAQRAAQTDYMVTSSNSRDWTTVAPAQSLLFDTYVTFDDSTAPTTTFSQQPAARTTGTTADFTFSATDADNAANTLTYQCKLDTGAFAPCTSPVHLTSLGTGSHTFIVEATDPFGNTETPGVNQTVTWFVDTTAPTVAIDSGPTQPGTTSTSAAFNFHGGDPDGVSDPVTFQCKLDTGTFATCTSPTSAYTNLPDGPHTFTVQATDSVGNLSAPTTYTWTVDTHPATIALANPAGDPQQETVNTTFAQPLQVVVENSLGQPLSGVAVTFTITAAANGATAALTTPAATDASGLTSVTATANTVAGGPYTVTANVSPALGTPAAFTLTNTPGPATTLTVAGYPSPVVAGVAHPFTVTELDQYGNVATGYSGTVRFTSSDTRATLPADSPFVAGDAGVHSFSAAFGSSGVQSLTATDTATSTVTGTQTGITVTAAPLVSIAVTPGTVALKVGQQQTFAATGAYADGTTADITGQVTWASDPGAVVAMDPTVANRVTAQAAGTTHISATQAGISGLATVTVTGAVLTGVQPGPAPASRPSGATSGGAVGGAAPVAVPPGR